MSAVRLSKATAAILGVIFLGGCENGSTLPPYFGGYVEDYKKLPHFRAFVMSGGAGSSSAAANWSQSKQSVQEAIDDAMSRCKARPYGYVCKLLYIGDTYVGGMDESKLAATIDEYSRSTASIYEEGFDFSRAFGEYETKAHFRAFATSPEGPTAAHGYSYYYRTRTVEIAIDRAMQSCRERMKKGKCEIYSIGNIIVSGMTAKELERAKAVYSENPTATNNDL